MKIKEAYEILGLTPKAGLPEIKVRYRQLMLTVHPDVSPFKKNSCPYTAQEINLAYSVLKEACKVKGINVPSEEKSVSPKKKTRPAWNAPVNDNAYAEREVLHYAEDFDGNVFGVFPVVKGKYMWTAEEDFPLFLRSVYQCGKDLLDEIDEALRRRRPPQDHQRIQAELTYLLAQQFTDGTNLLQEFAEERKTDTDEHRIFYISAMLEPTTKPLQLKAEETLYPGKIRHHRLYLKNKADRELGYLSFRDDRLYYVVVPLFEQRRVQVSIRAAKEQPSKSRKASCRYKSLHLWLKLLPANESSLPESLSLQIGRLLEEYKRLS